MSNIKLVVFDLDGTLVNAFDDIAAAANHALGVLGRSPLSVAEISKYVGHGGRNLMRSCLGAGATDHEIDRAFEAWRSFYAEHPADFAQPYPGTIETLQELRRRDIHTAVISNKLDELTRMILEKLHLDQYFDAIQGEIPGRPRKPDPEVLRLLMKDAGASEEQTLMVGDGDADMNVAKNASVIAIGVSYGVSPAKSLYDLGAATVLDSLPNLLDLLN